MEKVKGTSDSALDEEEGSYNSTAVLRHFIETYESIPELWDPTHPGYNNKRSRIEAMNEQLIPIYRKIKPGASRFDVRMKINSLRTNFRKELKKIEISTKAGIEYQPTSWVFYALLFLKKIESRPKQDERADEVIGNTEATNTNVITEKILQSSQHSLSKPGTSLAPAAIRKFASQSSSFSVKKPRMMECGDKEEKVLELMCKYLQNQKESQNALPLIVKIWGEKYKNLDEQQKLLAEKAINDILFEACLGNLHRNSVKINENSVPEGNISIQYTTSSTTN